VNLLSRFAKIADGVVIAVRPPINAVGLSLKAPIRIKLPEKEPPEADPSSLAALNPVFKSLLSMLKPGKLMNTASAEAFCGKMHGRRNSKKRPKEERPSSGGIDEVLTRLCRRKLWRLKKRIK
jgi:hypothetical protein